uniref:plastoquinol--plastocyanin reductase n=1 Tax=Compsopogon caeruleus TaxID=31354 RepID=A0A7S1THJ4_9RHOD|mmetsp:Transcript_686/g.1422  ORF Transcript_686/g.1422 Transcript_686/m.1422 type:complete len:220 (+) Transcript_686:156-815(+)|eukprot:CAMPEP_0184682580 /NCGR_PEP_ID=MMETSP0312-20130426/7835_1 /TAXON_ID=31354 /ORGANISM="Compsopogon coeruleus, Strain SAG 36.94" /LENGTH=219 /DNA_ID=CAMNT_0027134339 /DNA_START=99 /DNA_END=758 /DNA_ORIENTATION=+
MAFVSGFSVVGSGRRYGEELVCGVRRAKVAGRGTPVRMMAASAASADEVPDMNKRITMNLLLAGTVGVPATSILAAYAYFFLPKGAGSVGGGLVAKDALGKDVKKAQWLETHPPGTRKLVEGLKGDAYYLITTEDNDIEYYALNAVCTHLGCVVPWNAAQNKFMCPCHGSQYDKTGKVIRGPAPLSLALAHAEVDTSDNVILKPWTEEDFRTNSAPWWK